MAMDVAVVLEGGGREIGKYFFINKMNVKAF